MSTFLPAAPGWYVRETDDEGEYLDPVIAWKASTDDDDGDILLPAVEGGQGYPPIFLTVGSFADHARSVVYRPDHDPASDA
ncbi:hypothetical protein [Streptomyces sp. CC228A]|uniref:hypothetical protein n=1 Tax=Streptomyces sp. CC228A TaxID=2898186 RepID=UPI001F1D2E0F|nr:hypothetical protein [Streptomyces sp. CC228A]